MDTRRPHGPSADRNRTGFARYAAHQKLRIWWAVVAITVALVGGPALASDCVGSAVGSVAVLRSSPNASAARVGQLQSGATAPLIGIIPRWYETRTPTGQPAFVSKQSSNIVQCPAAQPLAPPAGASEFELHAIDVGTGLAVLVIGGDFTLLFDAGSNDDLARGPDNRALAYMNTLEPLPTRIDHLLLSHPHRDHVELMPDIFTQFQVVNVWNSGAYNDICGYRHFLRAIAAEPGVRYRTATQDAGDEVIQIPKKKCYGNVEPQEVLIVRHEARIDDAPIPLGQNATMRILHADGSKHASFNENSLVVRLELGSHSVLLMGDAEAGGRKLPATAPVASSIEGTLLACCAGEIKADVLVVGHHGSMTSSRKAFLNAVGAKLFIVSSGPTKYSKVVLPDDEVITELEGRGDVFRTDIEDDQCAVAPDKVGSDSDGRVGGCDNIVVHLPTAGTISAEYRQFSD